MMSTNNLDPEQNVDRASLAAWRQAWRLLGVSHVSDTEYLRVSRAYEQPARAYHNLSHIADCLVQFDPCRQLAEHPACVEIAIWYHDIVYDARRNDNESLSAQWAEEALAEHGVSLAARRAISELILATKHDDAIHSNDAIHSADAKLIVDLDLSILGQSEEKFRA